MQMFKGWEMTDMRNLLSPDWLAVRRGA